MFLDSLSTKINYEENMAISEVSENVCSPESWYVVSKELEQPKGEETNSGSRLGDRIQECNPHWRWGVCNQIHTVAQQSFFVRT